jgi:hypothetical protein
LSGAGLFLFVHKMADVLQDISLLRTRGRGQTWTTRSNLAVRDQLLPDQAGHRCQGFIGCLSTARALSFARKSNLQDIGLLRTMASVPEAFNFGLFCPVVDLHQFGSPRQPSVRLICLAGILLAADKSLGDQAIFYSGRSVCRLPGLLLSSGPCILCSCCACT